MKKPQWIVIASALVAVAAIYSFGKIIPPKKNKSVTENQQHTVGDGHDHGDLTLSTDTILAIAKKKLSTQQVVRINTLENSITRGDVKSQQLAVYHQLSHFWKDSARQFAPYAWYEAEAARLENSEKTLTFAAHLFLDNLQQEYEPALVRWEAMQAKDLFERSLKINPDNDSSKAGLGACYLFGNISPSPMEGINKIREVAERDSTHVFAQMLLAKGALLSGQNEKGIERLLRVNRLQPGNLEAILMLADIYERTGDKANAITWYEKSLPFVNRADAKAEVEKRIRDLKK